ncbi:hypothetical protein LB504_001748 [Fusarium proliferatum]|nr:hypothetical protein LB504_001748 [Fusarium proliferatum]
MSMKQVEARSCCVYPYQPPTLTLYSARTLPLLALREATSPGLCLTYKTTLRSIHQVHTCITVRTVRES